MGVYRIILAAGRRIQHAFIGCLRSAAQIVSYEIAMDRARRRADGGVEPQPVGHRHGQDSGAACNIWPLFPCSSSTSSGIAETNRHPFDVAKGVGDRRRLPRRIFRCDVRSASPST
jgi:NADH-quinone oxidoreductase subunit H